MIFDTCIIIFIMGALIFGALAIYISILIAIIYLINIIIKTLTSSTNNHKILPIEKCEYEDLKINNRMKIINSRLTESNYESDYWKIGDYSSIVYYKKSFKPELLMTQMNTFIFLSKIDNVTIKTLKKYIQSAMKFSIDNNQGLIRGLQSGIVVIPVIVSKKIDCETINYIEKTLRKHFALIEMPVIVNLKNEQIHYYKGTPFWGMIYYPAIRQIILDHFQMNSN